MSSEPFAGEIAPGPCPRACRSARARPRWRPPPASGAAPLAEMLEAVGAFGRDLALVLDDYHAIRDPQSTKRCARSMKNQPFNLHLAAATRSTVLEGLVSACILAALAVRLGARDARESKIIGEVHPPGLPAPRRRISPAHLAPPCRISSREKPTSASRSSGISLNL